MIVLDHEIDRCPKRVLNCRRRIFASWLQPLTPFFVIFNVAIVIKVAFKEIVSHAMFNLNYVFFLKQTNLFFVPKFYQTLTTALSHHISLFLILLSFLIVTCNGFGKHLADCSFEQSRMKLALKLHLLNYLPNRFILGFVPLLLYNIWHRGWQETGGEWG